MRIPLHEAPAIVMRALLASSKHALGSIGIITALLCAGPVHAQQEGGQSHPAQPDVMTSAELPGLSGTFQGGSITLRWTSLAEHHSDYHVIERSVDAGHFQPIGLVEAAGETQQQVDYSFKDSSPLTGMNSYRLKHVTPYGAYEYGPTVVVLGDQGACIPTAYPNPATDVVNLAFEMPVAGTAYVQVLDEHGRVIRDRDGEFGRGPQTLSIRVQDLASGTYDLRLLTTAHGGLQNIRFVRP